MKHNIISISIVLSVLSACSFLDVVPEGTPSKDDIFSTPVQAEYSMYYVYGQIPNISEHQYTPDFCGGGEVISSMNGNVRSFQYKALLYGLESASLTYFGLWDGTTTTPAGRTNYDLYKAIRNGWTVYNNLDGVVGLSDAKKKEWKAEMLFMVGYLHWCLMEYYGPIVIVDNEISLNEDTDHIMRQRSDWDTCAEFICDLFDRAAQDLPATRSNQELGRATSVAAKAYKSRVLMYSASALVNGNPDYDGFLNYDNTPMMPRKYDAERWKKALDACKEAIDLAEANGHKLYEAPEYVTAEDGLRGMRNYANAFTVRYNTEEFLYAFGDQTGPQVMQRYSTPRALHPKSSEDWVNGFRTSVVPTMTGTDVFLTENGLPLWVDPLTKDGFAKNHLMDIEPGDETCRYNRHREPRYYANVGFDRGYYTYQNGLAEDKKNQLFLRAGELHGYTGNQGDEYVSESGFVCQKYISQKTSYNTSNKTFNLNQQAFPLFRLAELYLDYAEADFEYDGSLSEEGLQYLNKIRHRCGLPNFEDSWAIVGGLPTGEQMREALHLENKAELFEESRWFHNVRRWNEGEEVIGKVPMGLNIMESTAEKFYTLVPMRESGIRNFKSPKSNWLAIPLSEIEIDNKLVQNPGY